MNADDVRCWYTGTGRSFADGTFPQVLPKTASFVGLLGPRLSHAARGDDSSSSRNRILLPCFLPLSTIDSSHFNVIKPFLHTRAVRPVI